MAPSQEASFGFVSIRRAFVDEAQRSRRIKRHHFADVWEKNCITRILFAFFRSKEKSERKLFRKLFRLVVLSCGPRWEVILIPLRLAFNITLEPGSFAQARPGELQEAFAE